MRYAVLEESIDFSGLGIDVHIEISWSCREARYSLDICGECVAVLC
jgi:hypothetical protein